MVNEEVTGMYHFFSLYTVPWPFPPVWGVADNTKKQQCSVPLHSSSNDKGPSQVRMALLVSFFIL